jgi:tripartite-type tricarboxylate transporter receptor subunit TctC
MMLPRTRWRCVGLSALVALAAFVSGAQAQTYPTGPVRIISMHPPGSVTDVLARPLALQLNASLSQPVVVENRPGANGILATGLVAKAPADGYTLLITSGSHIANAHVSKNLTYDPIKDFETITQLSASYGLALITNLPVKSVEELVELAKKKPGQLTYATNGAGNVTHVAGLLLEMKSGIKMIPVPYNTPALTTDVIAGTVDMAFLAVSQSAPLVNEGRIKALAVTGSRRSPALPNTPTMQELGFKDFDVTGYFGLLAPAHTPPDRVDLIYRDSVKALGSSALQRVIDNAGQYVVGSTPAEFAAFLKQDYAYQGKLMDDLDLKPK